MASRRDAANLLPRGPPDVRVLWTHNCNPAALSSLVYVNTAADGLRARGTDPWPESLGNLRSIANLRRARARVRELSRDYDLVHAQYGSACAVATAAAGIPRVVSIRGNDWAVHSESFGVSYVH